MQKSLIHWVAYQASIFVPLFFVTLLLWLVPETEQVNEMLTIAKVFWFTSAIYILINVLGILYGSPHETEKRQKRDWVNWNEHRHLIVAYVSRGDNEVALRRAIKESRAVLDKMGVNYTIEAITDMPVEVGADVSHLVPKDYQTAKRAKFKARALHYAVEQRGKLTRHDWILHMDEESMVTEEVVRGIAKYVQPDNAVYTIGQGEIKYNAHNYGKHMLITAIDAVRTGDDLGRFRFQYKVLKRPIFGMHGSFILVPAILERAIGFDLGGKGSITEDAYFALIAASKGVKFGWVDGYIREQSPFTLMELLKQRRRWISGLRLLVLDNAVPFKDRAFLMLTIFLCHISWLAMVVTVWNLVAGGSVLPTWVEMLAAMLTGFIAMVYMIGAYRNVTDIKMPFHKQLTIWLLAGLLVPVSCVVEAVAVVYSMTHPVNGVFEIVNKN